MKFVLFGSLCCLITTKICFISFDLTEVAFLFASFFSWRGWTEGFMAFTSGSDKNVSMISSSFAQFMVFKVKPPSKVSYCYLHGDYSTSLCDILLFKIFTWSMTISFQIRYTRKMSCELIYSEKQFKPSTSLGFQLFLCAKSIIRNGGNTEEKL